MPPPRQLLSPVAAAATTTPLGSKTPTAAPAPTSKVVRLRVYFRSGYPPNLWHEAESMEAEQVEIKVTQDREIIVSGGRIAAVNAAKDLLVHMGVVLQQAPAPAVGGQPQQEAPAVGGPDCGPEIKHSKRLDEEE